jgi:hypothetical protein
MLQKINAQLPQPHRMAQRPKEATKCLLTAASCYGKIRLICKQTSCIRPLHDARRSPFERHCIVAFAMLLVDSAQVPAGHAALRLGILFCVRLSGLLSPQRSRR